MQLPDGNLMSVYQTVDGSQWVQRSTPFEEIEDWYIKNGEATFLIDGTKYTYPIMSYGMRESY